MNVASVKLFLEVVDAGSFSRVAARRRTVQSHISRQVADFESACGGRLFHRTGRGVTLTDRGARAAVRLRQWLEDTERLSDELLAESGRLSGEVRVGILPSAAHPLMTHVWERLQAAHPAVRLNVVEGQGAELDTLLDTGAVDLAVLFRHRRPSGRDDRLLSVAATFLVSAPGDPLTASPTLPFARLAGLRLVLPRRPSAWRNALDETARSQGFRLDAVADADSLTIQKELVMRHPGVYSVLGPYAFAAELAAGRVQATRLVKPALERHVTLALPKSGKLSPAARVVAETVQSLAASWGDRIFRAEEGGKKGRR